MPAWRSATPSSARATHSPSHPASSAAARDGDRAVAVAVGLDDRPHAGRRDGAARSTPTLWATASRSISAHAHRDVAAPCAQVMPGARARSGRASSRSPATSPIGRAERAAAAWIHAPARRRVERVDARRQQRADDAGQHVAGAGRRQPGVAGGHDEHVAAGRRRRPSPGPSAARRVRRSAASRRAAAMRSAPGGCPASSPNSPSCGVSTVGDVRAVAAAAPAPSAFHAMREQPVAVDDDRHRGAVARSPARRRRCTPRGRGPGPIDQRLEAVEVVEHRGRPVERRQPRRTTSGGRRRRRRRARQRHHPAAGPLRRRRQRGGRRRSCPGCRRRPARRATTCARSADAAATTPATSSASTRWARRRGGVEPDVDDLDVAGQDRARRRAAGRA